MNVAIYDRFATDNHAGRDALAADRLHKMRTWCEQNGHQILGEYIEQGNKHVGDDRPAFRQLQEDIFSSSNSIEAIVVLNASRLFRDYIELAVFKRKLQAQGMKLISATDNQNDHQNNHLIRDLIGLFDEFQSQDSGKHILRSMKECVRQGYFSGGIAPFGYKAQKVSHPVCKDKKRLALHKAESDVVRLIFDLRNYGSMGSAAFSPKQIADHLNKKKLLRRKRRWSPESVRKILRDQIYIGERVYNKSSRRTGTLKPESEWITVKVPAIVAPEVFFKNLAAKTNSSS